jgi:hypothetical protein
MYKLQTENKIRNFGITYTDKWSEICSIYRQRESRGIGELFTSVFTEESNQNYPEVITRNIEIQFDDKLFQISEANKLLKSLNVTNSPGPDQVHPKVLHELTDIIDTPFCMIFNSSYETSVVPEN